MEKLNSIEILVSLHKPVEARGFLLDAHRRSISALYGVKFSFPIDFSSALRLDLHVVLSR